MISTRCSSAARPCCCPRPSSPRRRMPTPERGREVPAIRDEDRRLELQPRGDGERGERPSTPRRSHAHAKDFAAVSSVDILAGFPEDTEGPDSKAKAEIWLKWDDFRKKMGDMTRETAKLAEVAKGGDEAAMKKQFGETGKTARAATTITRKVSFSRGQSQDSDPLKCCPSFEKPRASSPPSAVTTPSPAPAPAPRTPRAAAHASTSGGATSRRVAHPRLRNRARPHFVPVTIGRTSSRPWRCGRTRSRRGAGRSRAAGR